MTASEKARKAWDIWSDDDFLANAPNEVIADRITARVAAALESYADERLEVAATVAETWGYTFDYHSEFQPWSREANEGLRAQNRAIATKIRTLKGNES